MGMVANFRTLWLAGSVESVARAGSCFATKVERMPIAFYPEMKEFYPENRGTSLAPGLFCTFLENRLTDHLFF